MTSLSRYECIVVKIGSALLVEDGALRTTWLTRLCSEIADLCESGVKVVIVSSGAVALGCEALGLEPTKLTLPHKQACAAVGQSRLTRAYENGLSAFGIKTAQALLTLHDTEDRRGWLNAKATLKTLLDLGVVPIVNENDTVATEEIRYGDNDRLSARTAQMVGADLLLLLSDIDGLYTADPRMDPKAAHIGEVTTLTPEIMAYGGPPNPLRNVGSGGMATKLAAARIAVKAGCDMIIHDGGDDNPIKRLTSGARHTLFRADSNPKKARAQWIAGGLTSRGRIVIDMGAGDAIRAGRSLLAVGVTSVDGAFDKGDAIDVHTPDGRRIARGLTNHGSGSLEILRGLRSSEIQDPVGPVVIHSDDLVVL
ncbi:MAG: glutamate 5-kinase [Litorimonas sp.]